MRQVFNIVRAGRDAGIKFVQDSISAGKQISGWQVDDPVRASITKAGYGRYFVHRTGHSIGTEVHANGANMDNLEVHDERRILPNSCFSIEPGVYLEDFGVRSEVNMLVRSGHAEVTGKIQNDVVII
jgi:Xaa-Pro aminopeptidase